MKETSLKNVIRQTLASLERQHIEATPDAYEQEFKKMSKILNYEYIENNNFSNLVKKLSKDEKKIVIEKGIDNCDDLVQLLSNRLSNNDIKKLTNLLFKSLKPTVSDTLNKEINKIKEQVKESPKMLIQKDILMSIQKLIEQRIIKDKEYLENNTTDAIKLIDNINDHIGDAININQDGHSSIDALSKEMDTFDSTDINSMHTKLQNVANSMTQKISENTTKLEKNRSEIDILKDQVLKLEIELRTTRHENEIDHLTSVLTRKAYEKHVSVIEEKFKRTQNDYAIIFFDIDHFKKVNDTYGHEAGDLVLSTFAKVLLRSTRDIDIIGRYGGEEFIGIINYKKEEDLITYILRIKNLITKHLFKYKEHKISITFSAGVTIRSNNNSYEEALNLADELLYKAKNSGRNKIIFQSGIEL